MRGVRGETEHCKNRITPQQNRKRAVTSQRNIPVLKQGSAYHSQKFSPSEVTPVVLAP